jgi:hypothetical protein
MTYPNSGFQNQWGFYTSASAYSYAPPLGGGTPPAPGSIVVPQSPSGSVAGQSASFNFANTITSTQETLENVSKVDSAQQGTPALNAPNSFNSLNPAIFQTFRWE